MNQELWVLINTLVSADEKNYQLASSVSLNRLMLSSYSHFPMLSYSLSLLGGQGPFLTLFSHPGFFLSPCSLPLQKEEQFN